ncbi:MAG TPA: Hpt domain-containing protein [Methylophilaceae bacterium]|nr:Hpt domain-containing protein [Methylophilaceae bacterium]
MTWVKDEIDQALASVLENLSAVAANPEELAPLRFSQTHLYQVSGALDMVGLEGCKRFCAEMEKVAGALEKKTVAATPEVLATMTQAVETLRKYLDDLLAGAADFPLKLFPVLQALGALHGQGYEESELFFVDTSIRAPKDLPSRELDAAALPAFVAEQRGVFQKALLGWLKNGSAEALSQMSAAMEHVREVQVQPAQKTLWWAATALMAALAKDDLAAHPGVKRLFRRIDQQLRSLTENSTRAVDSLLRNILYYIALSKSDAPLVQQAKDLFELRHFMPEAGDEAVIAEVTAEEMANVEQLKAVLGSVKDLWAGVSEGTEGALDQVMNGLGEIIMSSQDLSNQTVANLFGAVHELATAMDLDATRITEPWLIEGATGLNLLEDALNSYEKHDKELVRRMENQILRLQEVMGGGPMADFSGMPMSDHLDSEVLLAVAQQVLDALKVAEQSLDTYFRNPGETQVLESVDKPLQQVLAAFDMLDMPVPTAIVKASLALIQQFQTESGVPDPSLFELVAESLSMVGFYVEELPRRRPESEEALDGALERLQARMQSSTTPAADETPEETQVTPPADQPMDVIEPSLATTGIPDKKPGAVRVSVTVAPVKLNASETKAVDATDGELPVEVMQETSPTTAQAAAVIEGTEDVELTTDRAFDPELLDIYLTEAEEVLATIAQNLQTLRVNATDHEALVEVRRGFHTLKGSGRTVGLVALGEVAWSVERLLNQVMERKVIPTAGQIAFIEEASAEFAGWAAKLRETGEVELDHKVWQHKATALEQEREAAKPAAQAEEVIIGGTHKLSRTLFNIFLGEANQHMQTLRQGLSALSKDSTAKPTDASRRAAHTLASNAGTAGFKAICDLARALEHWLDAHQGNWNDQSLTLIERVVDALEDMLRKASQLRQPKQISGLIAALKEATIEASTTDEVDIETPSSETMSMDEPASALDDLQLDLPPSLDITTEEVSGNDASSTSAMDFDLPELDIAQQADPEADADAEPPVTAAVTEPKPEKPSTKPAKKAAQVSAVDQELITMFTEEARELVPQVGTALRTWRANPTESEHPDTLQRALHTLKGSARMAGQSDLGDTVHGMEDRVIKALKNQVSMADFDDLFVDLDRISALLEELTGASVGGRGAADVAEAPKAVGRSADRRAQFLRLRSDILDRLINEAGEISIARSRMDREMQGFKNFSLDLTESVFRLRNYLREMEIEAESQLQSRMSHLQETHEAFDPLEFDRFTRLQELTRMMAESVNDVATIQHGLLMNLDETESALQQQNRMNRELQHGLMNVRMVPFSLISERLQRIVRQTARELEKQVDMTIDGEGVEIDRSVLEKIGAPLEHLLRNAVAHGMEAVAERKKLKKPETGSIALKVRQESDEIILTVTDDGSGIKLERVREKAIERGLLNADQAITEQALLFVIFEPGFSTAENISQIAGRGVGLDAVRSDITALGGRIDVNNAPGQGAVFTIYLPVTLSVSQVVLVRSAGKIFAVPSVMVEQVQKLKPAALTEAEDRKYIDWSGRQYPLHFLGKLIGDHEHEPEPQRYTPILLLRSGNYRIALHVDEIIGNQEVVMKSIGAQLSRVPGIVGATVMGDGSIILITNPVQLANREVLAAGSVKVTAAPAVVAEIGKTVVMVVDDSLTMRKVLGRLLEREGYEVIVAKDGMEGIQKLQETLPDIILSDIEMPRMDGFEFSRNVRADARTAGIPIIIISSRTAEKHQNHAKELGVNAFLGKPVQDDELITQITALIGKRSPVVAA